MSVQYSNIPNQQHGDMISNLPVDKNPPTPNEIQIVDTLFKKHPNAMQVIMNESKDAILAGLLVILFCLEHIDNMIKRVLPITENSPYMLFIIKGVAAAILFWIIKHFYLSRK